MRKEGAVLEEKQNNRNIGDEVYIELIHSVKEIIVLLVEKLCTQKRIAE